jgi:hypothetical protein
MRASPWRRARLSKTPAFGTSTPGWVRSVAACQMVSRVRVRPGQRLQDSVCSVELIVIEVPAADMDFTCGGAPMVRLGVRLLRE